MSDFVPHPAVDPRCKVCAGLSYVVRPTGEVAVAELCACVGKCPHCRGTGWTRGDGGPTAPLRRCVCHTILQRLERFRTIGIPARMSDRSLQPSPRDSLNGRFRLTSDNRAAHKAVYSYLQDYEPGRSRRGLVLHGHVGRGKTHLLVGLVGQLVLRHGITARFVEFSHLLHDIKYGFDRGEGPGRLLEPLVRVDVLAIDELGKGMNTEFEGTVVDELVSRRYNAMRTVLATTNYGPGEPTGLTSPNLANPDRGPTLPDRVGTRVYSRLQEMCDFVTVGGEDWRERLRAARI